MFESGLLTVWCKHIRKVEFGAELKIRSPILDDKDEGALASPPVPHVENLIQLRVQELPLGHGEGGGNDCHHGNFCFDFRMF